MSYDSWLERPYQDRYDDAAAYEAWLEENYPDDEDDENRWDEFVQAMEDADEARAEDAAERAADYARENDYFD